MYKWMAVLAALSAAPLAAEPAGRTLRLSAALESARADETQPVWVFFRDKGEAAAPLALTPRALARRQARGALPLVTAADAPVVAAYVAEVARIARLRHTSRWFNAASLDATPAQVEALAALPFVERLDLVARFRRRPEPAGAPVEAGLRASQKRTPAAIDYGPSLGQLEQIGVPALHRAGYDGTGVLIAVFDAGFDNLGHEAFASTKIVAQYDFVNGDLDVANGSGRGEGSHGTSTLSVIGGYRGGHAGGPGVRRDLHPGQDRGHDARDAGRGGPLGRGRGVGGGRGSRRHQQLARLPRLRRGLPQPDPARARRRHRRQHPGGRPGRRARAWWS